MKKLNQRAFTTVEYLIAAIAVLVIIGIGLFVLSSNSSPQAIIMSKQKYIDSKVSKINQNNYTTLANQLYQNGYITQSLYKTTESLINSYNSGDFSSNSAYSTMICVSYIPDKFSYGQVQLNSTGSAGALSVNVYVPYSATATKYSADWVLNGSWQLNSVSC